MDPLTIKEIPDAPYFEALPGKDVKQGTSHKKYIAYQFAVVKELCTKYGKVDIFWFDAAYWGGMFTADMWDAENLTRMIRKLQPGIIINNRTGLPGDFDTPEQRVGMYQQRPWESCMTLNGSWAYSPAAVRPLKVLIRELLSAAAGNGNVLLSWGALWNGAFDPSQKKVLLEIGQWLKKYGRAYYSTKGGPWVPDNQRGSTFRDNKIFLYVYNWKSEKLSLPALPGNTVLKAAFVNLSEKLLWKQMTDSLRFTTPAIPDSIVTIIELTMKYPVIMVADGMSQSVFNDPAYGSKINTTYIKSDQWKNNQVVIDLGQVKNVTGLGIFQNNDKLSISVAADTKQWERVDTAVIGNKEVSLTTFIAGAHVIGRPTRYIQLRSLNKLQDVKVEVYAK